MAFVPTLDLHEHTLPGLLRRNAERLPDNDCIVAPEFGVCWSWKEFDRRTSEVARGMYAMGIRKGDHVAIWSTNTPEWMLTMFASAKLGAILVTVNTNYKQFELNYLLNQSDTKMLVMTPASRTTTTSAISPASCPPSTPSSRTISPASSCPSSNACCSSATANAGPWA